MKRVDKFSVSGRWNSNKSGTLIYGVAYVGYLKKKKQKKKN